jgi:glucose-1-phosphate adenylyltransferase
LTQDEAKPAVTVKGGCRLIDFVLSNLVNSGIDRIGVVLQYKPQSLLDHLRDVWDDADRTGRRIVEAILPDASGIDGQIRGTAEAVRRCRDLIRAENPDLVAVFAADHVYRMDVRQMAAFHVARRADVTIGAVPVPISEAHRFGVITALPDGRIRGFQEKPAHPQPMDSAPDSVLASMGNYLFRTDLLLTLLDEAHDRRHTDLGHHVLPGLPERCRTYAYDLRRNIVPGLGLGEEPGYWRDVGTLEALEQTRGELGSFLPPLRLWNPEWPVRGARVRLEGHPLRHARGRATMPSSRDDRVAATHPG